MKILKWIAVLAASCLSAGVALAQETDAVKPDTQIVAEQYLLTGTPTRGCGESQVAVNPVNPNQIAVAAMCIINTNLGKFEQTEEEFTHTPRGTITHFLFSRDRGLTWTEIEDPMRDYFRRYRCLDPFAAFTPSGRMILGCEAHFPIAGTQPEDEINKAVYNTRQHMGGSALIYSDDGGHTFSKPIQIIHSFMPKEIMGPFVSYAPTGSQGDRPEIRVDISNGKIYVDGKSSAAEPAHRQTTFRMSDDGGVSFRMVYAFDSAEYPQSGGTSYDAANGMLAVAYTASKVPDSLNAKCPCRVFGVSTDDGKTFVRSLIPVPAPAAAAGGPGGGGMGGGMTVLANPVNRGMFTVLIGSSNSTDAYITMDAGKTWTKAGTLNGAPSTTMQGLVGAYSPKGVMALSWRAMIPLAAPAPRANRGGWHDVWKYVDLPQQFEIWSAVSRDGGKTFSAPVKVSTTPSPGVSLRRSLRNLGADYISVAADSDFIHMSWYDDRAGFRATWYGRVPLADFK